MLPNFLIIGAPRSATTLLSKCFSEHPEIYMAALGQHSPGDIHFFNVSTEISYQENFQKGIAWYQQLFTGVTSEKAIGEKTAHYLSDPQAPAVIQQYLPDVRMIAILRNPIERAYSDYWYHLGEISYKMSFLEACFSEKTKRLLLIEAGLYYEQIMRYLEYFDRSRFLFLLYDDLQADSLGTIQNAYNFIGVNPDFVPVQYNQRINAALAFRGGSFYLRLFGGLVKQNLPRLFKLAGRLPITSLIQEKISRDNNTDSKESLYQTMSTKERTTLANFYYEQNYKLSELLEQDLIALWHS